MVTRSALLSCLASVAFLVVASPSSAVVSKATAANASLEKSQRAQLNHDFTSKWSTYAQRVYDVPADVWSKRMAPVVAAADPSNLSKAMERDTFEGAMAELSGVGTKLSDDKAITMLASGKGGTVTPQVLGSLSNDLVYTPIQPCRIVDTRNTLAGPILAGQTRSYDAFAGSFTSQGGSATNCGLASNAFTAIAVNLTAVFPANAGFATAYPFNTVRPNASSVNYTAGAIVNNGLLIQIPNPLQSDDFTLWTLSTSDFVVDVVGYFAPPVATALECESVPDPTPTVILPGQQGDSVSGNCSAGYTIVSGECNTSLNETRLIDNDVNANNYGCQAFNGAGTNETLNAVARCCRVPGR
jgi:hypothetical protein